LRPEAIAFAVAPTGTCPVSDPYHGALKEFTPPSDLSIQ
jgi:hypothetical protein